jgi:GNAT superfamily N-acetyltransferase
VKDLPADLRERPLEAGDMPALTELARICDETYLEWTGPGWTVPLAPRGWADRYLKPDAWSRVAMGDAGLVATVAFPTPRRHDASAAHVGLVFVHPSRWREDIARTMLTRTDAEMIARGYVREQLWTPLGAPAEAFYVACGWARDGRREWHPWVGLEMVGYARDLV